MKKIFYTFLMLSVVTLCLVACKTQPPTLLKGPLKGPQQFIAAVKNCAQKENQSIRHQRQRTKQLEETFKHHGYLSHAHEDWILALASEYEIKKPYLKSAALWAKLNSRVDEVPWRLVVAQAINESAWGQSRFAKEANNYFGQHCVKKGCGIVPRRLAKGSSFGVTKFSSMQSSVSSYMHNLNTNFHYQSFRAKRAKLREENKPLDAIALADELEHYAERDRYSHIIQSIIRRYLPNTQ